MKERPPFLKIGDKVAIVSPSGAVNPEYVNGALHTLRSWQLNPVVGTFAKTSCGRFAGTDEQRLDDLQKALDDTSVRAIFCSRGGYGLMRIVDKLNFDIFVQHPKWLIGFSDITILHAAAFRHRVQSIHAQMAKVLAYNAETTSKTLLRKLLFGAKPEPSAFAPDYQNYYGETEGVLIGGNLSVLYGLRGTPFDIQPKGKILFIEDISEKPYHIDRMMQNLRLGGILSRLSGLLVGQFTDFEEDPSFGKTVKEIISSESANYGYPLAFNFPVGHVEHNFPIVHGAKIKLTVTPEESRVIYV